VQGSALRYGVFLFAVGVGAIDDPSFAPLAPKEKADNTSLLI